MRNADYCERVESYCHCPYCEALVSDQDNVKEVLPDAVISCPVCKRRFKVIA